MLDGGLQSLAPVRRLDDAAPPALQHPTQHLARIRVIVNYQHPRLANTRHSFHLPYLNLAGVDVYVKLFVTGARAAGPDAVSGYYASSA